MKIKALVFFLLVSLKLAAQCDTVTAVSATSVSYASAQINFTTPGVSLNYVVVYIKGTDTTRQNINDPGGPYPAMITAPLSGLTPSTAYTYYIVRRCNPTDSALTSNYNFTTTAPTCDSVATTSATVTNSGATIASTEYTYGDTYTIFYVQLGQTDTLSETGADADFTLAGLRNSTQYYYRIRTNCTTYSDSATTGLHTFTTSNSPAYVAMTSFGYQDKRGAIDSTLSVPTFNGEPDLRNGKNDKGALAVDSTNGRFYWFNPVTQAWYFLSNAGAAVADSIAITETVPEMKAYAENKKIIVNRDSLRGGAFNLVYDTVNAADDAGTYFNADSIGTGYFWKRDVTQSQAVNAEWFGAVGDSATDNYTALNLFAAYMSAHGGTGIIPKGTFLSSGEVRFYGSNITLIVQGNLKSTSDTALAFIRFESLDNTSPLYNVKVLGEGGYIDGSASIITTPYTSNNQWDALRLKNINGFEVRNLSIKNGFAHTFRSFGGHNGIVDNCIFTGARNENGCTIIRDYLNAYDTVTNNPATAGNIIVSNCIANNNIDYGFNAFDVHNVTFLNCVSFNNGNNDTTQLNTGGGLAIEDATGANKNRRIYNVAVINFKSIKDTSAGIFCSANGVTIDAATTVDSVTTTRTDVNNFYGNGLYFANTKYVNIKGTYRNNQKAGLLLLNTDYPFVGTVNVVAENNGREGLTAKGIDSITVSGDYVRNNAGINLNNTDSAKYNSGLGIAIVTDAQTFENNTYSVQSQNLNTLNVIKHVAIGDCQASGTGAILPKETQNFLLTGSVIDKGTSTHLTEAYITIATDTVATIYANRFINLDYTAGDITDKGSIFIHSNIPYHITNHVATDTLMSPIITGEAGAGKNLHIDPTGYTQIGTNMYVNGTGQIGLGTSSPNAYLTFGSGITNVFSYNTADQTTDYERVRMLWSGNQFLFQTAAGGTGTIRDMVIGNTTANTIFKANGVANYSANFGSLFTANSHVDKNYVDSSITAIASPIGIMANTFGAGVTVAGATTQYGSITTNATLTATENSRRIVMPFACTLTNFILSTTGTQPNDGAVTVTVRKNGVATAIVATIPANGAAGNYSYTSTGVSFAQGDKITVEVANASASTSSTIYTWSIGVYK